MEDITKTWQHKRTANGDVVLDYHVRDKEGGVGRHTSYIEEGAFSYIEENNLLCKEL